MCEEHHACADPLAFETLLARFWKDTYSTARGVVGDLDAYDVTMDAWCKVFRKWPATIPEWAEHKQGKYLRKVALSTAVDFWRKQRRVIFLEQPPDVPDSRCEPALQPDDPVIVVGKALLLLDPDKAGILRMYYFSGLTCKQIAAHLRVSSPTTAWNRVQEAMKEFRLVYENLTKGANVSCRRMTT